MKVTHSYGHAPAFEMNFDERAIFISALQTFCLNFPQDETAKGMLHTAEQIDLAYRIMAEQGEKCLN
jgi:hypothetical protein